MEKLQRAAQNLPCTCDGRWAPGATSILEWNSISVDEFCSAVCRALQLGSVRHVNVLCAGPRGCGKSTLLESLELVFRCHAKPEGGSTFAAGDLPQHDIMLWQDYEHEEGTIKFTDLLSLLCGESIGLRLPCQLNKKFRNTLPCFMSSPGPIVCSRRDAAKAAQLNGMMEERFATFSFWNPVPMQNRILGFPQCGRCCAGFFLGGLNQNTSSNSSHAAPGDAAVPVVANSSGLAAPSQSGPNMNQLRDLVEMRREGLLDEDEFRAAKRRLLGL